MIDNTSLTKSLTERRRALGISQIVLASALNTSRYSIIRFEQGSHEFSFSFLQRYAEAVRCTIVTGISYRNDA